MKKHTPQNTSDNGTVDFPPPLLLLVDNEPEDEIFIRLGSFLENMGWDGWRSFYDRVVAQSGVVHEHPYLRAAWSGTGDLGQLKELLVGGPKALVLMDLNFGEKGSTHGIKLVEQLLEISEVRENSVFLMKTTTESAEADEFRRNNISYLRTLRSLNGSEGVERIQFLGANANKDTSKSGNSAEQNFGNYESKLIGNLLLGLQEEALLDIIKSGYFEAEDCHKAIRSLSDLGFYGLFDGNNNLEETYKKSFLMKAFDDESFGSEKGACLNVGFIKRMRLPKEDGTLPLTTQIKKILNSAPNESHALELALLRHGEVAAVEAPLFVLGEVKKFQRLSVLNTNIINSKWKELKFDRMKQTGIGEVFLCAWELNQIIKSCSGEMSSEQQTEFRELLESFLPENFTARPLLDSWETFIRIRTFVRNHCSHVGCSVAAPIFSRLEACLKIERGLSVVNMEPGLKYSIDEKDRSEIKVNFDLEGKIYVAINRDQIAHNFVSAERRIRNECSGVDDIVEALRLDVQCGVALCQAAAFAKENSQNFNILVKRIEELRVPVGLPHPEKLEKMFTRTDTGEIKDIKYYLNPEIGNEGWSVSLIELVVAGLHVLKYHVESYLRILSWSSAITNEELFSTVRRLWHVRGWCDFFQPDIPNGVDDPMESAWGASVNLLHAFEQKSEVARKISHEWHEWLSDYEVVSSDHETRAIYKNGKEPPKWFRLLWLGLPLEYAAELAREVPVARGRKIDGTDGLDNLSVESDAADIDENDEAEEGIVDQFDVISESQADDTEVENEPATLPPGISDMKKRDRGNPKPTWKKLNTRLSQKGSKFTIREPLNEFEWDDAFTADVVEAVKILKADS